MISTIGRIVAALVASLVLGQPVRAADPTVEILLGQGYVVVAAISSPIGPGLFLQKGASLYACFVVETSTSPDLSTRYCKPVR